MAPSGECNQSNRFAKNIFDILGLQFGEIYNRIVPNTRVGELRGVRLGQNAPLGIAPRIQEECGVCFAGSHTSRVGAAGHDAVGHAACVGAGGRGAAAA